MAASRNTPLQIETSRAPGRPHRVDHRRRRLPVPAGHDDRVGARQRLQPVLDVEREPARGGRQRARVLGRDDQLVPPRHVELRPRQPEHLDDDAELERGDPGRDERDDAMHDGQILTHIVIQVTGRPVERSATLLGMTTAYDYFTRKLAFETDVADVAEALRDGTRRLRARRHPQRARLRRRPHPGRDQPRRRPASTGSRDGPLVVYCWGPACNGATKAGAKLAAVGREVKEMIGGFEYWVREGERGRERVSRENMSGWTRPSEPSGDCATPTAPATSARPRSRPARRTS